MTKGKRPCRPHADRGRRAGDDAAGPVAALRGRVLAAAAQDAAEILFELIRDSEDRRAIADRLREMADRYRGRPPGRPGVDPCPTS